jgi:hypothetical protein
MDWLWTWSGKCFGYRDGVLLWTYDGRHVGKFCGEEIFDKNGHYLGEIKNGRHLITKKSKKAHKHSTFRPHAKRAGFIKYTDYTGYNMLNGYEDFPLPDAL